MSDNEHHSPPVNPYAASTATPIAPESVPTVYREMTGLTEFLKVLLGLGVVMAFVSMLSSIMQAELLSRASFSEAQGQANDSREQIIGLFHLTVFLLTAVIFGYWIVRANKNVRALGANGLRISPGWAVGYFFVPIVNLWRPYQAMKELWQASHNPTSWTGTPVGPILSTWWTLWLLTNFLGQISSRVMMNAEGLEDIQTATFFQIVSLTVDIPNCIVAMSLVTRIAHAQKSHVENGT